MIVSIAILVFAILVAAALAGFVAWTLATSRANGPAGIREAEIARLSEQARRLPELIVERDQARASVARIEAEKDQLLQSIGSYTSTRESQEKLVARLDHDLAELYGVTTKRLNQQFNRNRNRFPEDFAFRLTLNEAKQLFSSRSQIATLKKGQKMTASERFSRRSGT